MKERKPIAPHEHFEQKSLFVWLTVMSKRHPEFGDFYAVPNGGARHPRVALKLKSEGVRPGVPDLETFHSRWGFSGLHIEMKRRWGYKVSDEQRDMMRRMSQAGRLCVVARGWEEAACWIAWYFSVKEWTCKTIEAPCTITGKSNTFEDYLQANVWGDPKGRIAI